MGAGASLQTAHRSEVVDVGEALELSSVGMLSGRPYPVQFRHQGAIDAWTRAVGHNAAWAQWA